MKRFFVFLLIGSLALLLNCGGGDNGKSDGGKHTVKGVAALGVAMPDGSPVEVRGVPTVTEDQILVGTWGEDNNEDWEYITTPSEIIQSTVSGGEGNFEVDVSTLTAPFLIRVQDTVSGKWYYGYAPAADSIGNVNPYTDAMVRGWYGWMNIGVDYSFTSGIIKDMDGNEVVYRKTSYGYKGAYKVWAGESLMMPNPVQMARPLTQLQFIVSLRWGIDIGNVLTRDWVIGESYDAILDNGTIDWAFCYTDMLNSILNDDMTEKWDAYYQGGTLTANVWSIYPGVCIDWPGIGRTNMTLIETVNGVNHFRFSENVSVTPNQVTCWASEGIWDSSNPIPNTGMGFVLNPYHK